MTQSRDNWKIAESSQFRVKQKFFANQSESKQPQKMPELSQVKAKGHFQAVGRRN